MTHRSFQKCSLWPPSPRLIAFLNGVVSLGRVGELELGSIPGNPRIASRPSYREIGFFREDYPDVPIMTWGCSGRQDSGNLEALQVFRKLSGLISVHVVRLSAIKTPYVKESCPGIAKNKIRRPTKPFVMGDSLSN